MRLSVVAAVACASVGIAVAQDANAAIKKSTNILSQGLGAALREFAQQRHLQFVYLSDAVDGLQTPGAVGEFTADEALTKLLSGTGLTYKYLDGTAITVYPSAAAGATQRSEGDTAQDDGFWQRFRLAQAQSPASSSTSGAANNDPESSGALEEIVVTAQKRAERLQDVPISISVLNGAQLDRSNLSVSDELARVPGVAALDAPFGGTLLTVRGVASAATNFGGTSPVGYYLESVPFGFIRQGFVPDSSVYDLERIEVLRGPQGTLYGVNAQNGVVRVLTGDPDLDDFGLKLRASTSSTEDGGDNFRGDMAANVALVPGKLAARAVVGYEDLSGWIDKPNEEDANGSELLNVRLKVLAQPTEDLSVGLMAWRTENDDDGRPVALDDRTTILAPEPRVEEYDVYALNVAYDFSAFSVSSSTSYIDYQVDTTVGDLGPTRPILSIFASEVFAQEVNLNSTAEGDWRWSLGAIYRDVKDLVHQRLSLFPNPNGLQYNDYSESFAVFGEVTRKFFGERLGLTGGLRYFEDKATNQQRSNPFNVNATLIRDSAKFDAVSPRIVLTWHPTLSLTTYASYAEGFRSGFPQSPTVLAAVPDFPAVDSDNLVNYEVGTKGVLWNDRASFDVAAFYIEWDDIQQNITVQTATTPVAAILNGESASGLGAEFSLGIRPAPGLNLGVSYSWNDLEFDADVISGGRPIFFAGDRLTNSPERTVGASFDWTFQLGQAGYQGEFAGSANYVSQRQARGLSNGVNVLVEGDEILTSSLSFAVHSPAGWSAMIYADNLTDEDGTPIPTVAPPAIGTNRLRPRTIGLQVEYRL